MPRLYAISDLHLRYRQNRAALEGLRPFPEDWLILGGDLGETEEELCFALDTCGERFAQLLWVPGNHELWTHGEGQPLAGEAKYRRLVELCRERGVLTPEDPFVRFPGEPALTLAPCFLLYDYTFRPDAVPVEEAVAWSTRQGVLCTDERKLESTPYPSKPAWCAARVEYTERRLRAAEGPFLVINHWPLREELVRLPRIPSFSIWCGTRRTQDWIERFPIEVVVYGHLHIRERRLIGNTRFEEVSLGYPRHWVQERGLEFYLREILPGPQRPRWGYLNPGKH